MALLAQWEKIKKDTNGKHFQDQWKQFLHLFCYRWHDREGSHGRTCKFELTLPTTSSQILMQGLQSKNSSIFLSIKYTSLNISISNFPLPITFRHLLYCGATLDTRTYYETFLACYNLVKNPNISIYLIGPGDNPLDPPVI